MSKFISGLLFGAIMVACVMGFKDTYSEELGYSVAVVGVILMGIIWMAVRAASDDEDKTE